MSLLLSHQITPAMRRDYLNHRTRRRSKAVLSILRIQALLGLNDEDLIYASSCVIDCQLQRKQVIAENHSREFGSLIISTPTQEPTAEELKEWAKL